jgi:hypothetical protein
LALLLVWPALALGSGACSVDRTGLEEMPIAPRDAGTDRVTGSAGFSGGAGAGGSGGEVTGAGGGGGFLANDDAGAGGGAGGGGAVGSDAGRDAAAGAGGVAGQDGGGGSAGAGGAADAGGAGGAGGNVGTCGPATCPNGCCAGGRCVTNLSTTQCGWAGAACAPCGPCQRCSTTGACGVDPSSRWLVLALSAELTMMAPGGGPWDPGGTPTSSKPDPFCEFEMPPGDLTNAGVTSTIVDSFTATWDQTISPVGQAIQASDLMSTNANRWLLWVGDDEFNGSGTVACQVHPPMQESWLLKGQFTLQNIDYCKSLTIGLVCQP